MKKSYLLILTLLFGFESLSAQKTASLHLSIWELEESNNNEQQKMDVIIVSSGRVEKDKNDLIFSVKKGETLSTEFTRELR